MEHRRADGLAVTEHLCGTTSVRVANLLAADDPASTPWGTALLREHRLVAGPLHLVVDCRPDRLERDGQMGELVAAVAPERTVPVAQLLGPVRDPASLVLVGTIHGRGEVLLDALPAAPHLVADRGSR